MTRISIKKLYEGNIVNNPELAASGSGNFSHLNGDPASLNSKNNGGAGPSGGGSGPAGGTT